VVAQQVVPVEAGAADGWSVQTSMGTVQLYWRIQRGSSSALRMTLWIYAPNLRTRL